MQFPPVATLVLFMIAFRDCLRSDAKYQKKYGKQARKLEKWLFNKGVSEDIDR
jgi:GrpB-like predicted nucleotidyltransferase (UPF0157 family)